MFLLAAGFTLSLFGSLPPGLISLTVSQTSITRGMMAAMTLAMGAAVAEFFQAWAAWVFTDWFLSHPAVERNFQWAAIPVFFTLGLFLLFWAKPPRLPNQTAPDSLGREFVKGVVVSAFNLLALPYWFVYCSWLRVEGWWQEGLLPPFLFSMGVATGTVFALTLYAWLGQVVLYRSAEIAKYANRLIGLIFLGLGLSTLIRLLW